MSEWISLADAIAEDTEQEARDDSLLQVEALMQPEDYHPNSARILRELAR